MLDKKLILIGDSITEGFDEKENLPDYQVQNLGVSGDSTEELLSRIKPGVFERGASFLFLCIGTNDIARDKDDEYILMNIKMIIARIKEIDPELKIVAVSIFPTRNNSPRPNSRIKALNKSIQALSEQSGAEYLDVFESFTGKDGELINEFTEDGLHLTAPAYHLWAEYIVKYLKKQWVR